MKNILDKINRADEIQAKKTELSKWQEEVLLMTEKDNLSKHEVNLSLAEDVKKYTNELSKLLTLATANESKLDKIVRELSPLVKESNDLLKKIKEIRIDANSASLDFKNAMKDLGLNPNENKDIIGLDNLNDSISAKIEKISDLLIKLK